MWLYNLKIPTTLIEGIILYYLKIRGCCVMVYVLTTFCIILYGLKFGRVKSFCWLTSITIGILQGVVVSSPFKIILISAVMAKYNSRTVVYIYCRFNLCFADKIFSRIQLWPLSIIWHYTGTEKKLALFYKTLST